MPNQIPCLALPFVLVPALAAQVVDPQYYSNSEGVSISSVPFTNIGRYQQVCPGMRGTARTINSISFRRDATRPDDLNEVARNVVVDVFMAETTVSPIGSTFASNYSSAPIQVATNHGVNLPDVTLQPRQSPGVFNVTVPLMIPFFYSGNADLIFEIVVRQNDQAGRAYALDAATGSNLLCYGPYTMNGTGCQVNGREVTLRSRIQDNNLPTGWNTSFVWDLKNAPPSTAALLMVGFTNPNAPIPGLCSPTNNLYTMPLITVAGATDPAGVWGPFLPALPQFNPALVGSPIESQVVAIDQSQPGIPAVVSNGVTSFIIPPPPVMNLARLYHGTDPNATTGTLNPSLANVVQFN
jgi:hypothetical protein